MDGLYINSLLLLRFRECGDRIRHDRQKANAPPKGNSHPFFALDVLRMHRGRSVFRRLGVELRCDRIHNTDVIFFSVGRDIDYSRSIDVSDSGVFFATAAFYEHAKIMSADAPAFADFYCP